MMDRAIAKLDVALKEWAVVCDALDRGEQIILLRKGGIYESAGEFEIEHRNFLLFPTYLHQKSEMLKAQFAGGLPTVLHEPAEVNIALAGSITDIVQVKDRATMDRLRDQHIWSEALIDMRFNYRPENPLYLLITRTYRLAALTTLQNTPAFAGCKSWVPLGKSIDCTTATPCLNDEKFEIAREKILNHMR